MKELARLHGVFIVIRRTSVENRSVLNHSVNAEFNRYCEATYLVEDVNIFQCSFGDSVF